MDGKTHQGIRFIEEFDIDEVQVKITKQARLNLKEIFISEVEVQMLSKYCPTMMRHLEHIKHQEKTDSQAQAWTVYKKKDDESRA